MPYLELTSLGSTSGAGGIGISCRLMGKKISSRFRLIINESSLGMSNASLSKSLAILTACDGFLAFFCFLTSEILYAVHAS